MLSVPWALEWPVATFNPPLGRMSAELAEGHVQLDLAVGRAVADIQAVLEGELAIAGREGIGQRERVGLRSAVIAAAEQDAAVLQVQLAVVC